MRAFYRFTTAVLVASWLVACHHKIISDDALDERAVERVAAEVSRVRGLDFVRPVKVELIRPRALRRQARGRAERARASGRPGREGQLLAMLGLVPWGTDPAAAGEAIVGTQPGGAYEPGHTRLTVVAREHVRSEVIELVGLFLGRDLTYGEIVAHELTHALQHQNFGLDPPPGAATNRDMRLAHAALVEGDATLVGFEQGVGGLVTDLAGFLAFARRHAPDMGSDVPLYYQEEFKFPYLDGGPFVLALQAHGGTTAIDRAHRTPPLSTEQVLHPDKYLHGSDPPLEIDTSGLEDAADAPAVHRDTLGEFGMRILLGGGEAAARRAAGWGGDRAVLFEDRRSGGLSLVWVCSFDTPADAADFATGLEQQLRARHGPPRDALHDTLRWRTGRRLRHLELWQQRVVLVDVPAGVPVQRLVEAAFACPASPRTSGRHGAGREENKEMQPGALAIEQAVIVEPPPPVSSLARRQSVPAVRIEADPAGDSWLALGALLQVAGGRADQSGLGVDRLRTRAQGRVTRSLDLTLRAEAELAPGEAGLLDAVISFAPVSPELFYLGHLHIGRQRVPHARELLVDPEHLVLFERNLGARTLAPRRRTGLLYQLDLTRHGIPLRLEAGGFDGFPEGEGFGPLSVVRLEGAPLDPLGTRLGLVLGASYQHDARHLDTASGEVRDRQSVALDICLRWRGLELEGDLLLADRAAEQGFESSAWSAAAGFFVLPDFLQLAVRYERIAGPDLDEAEQLTAGVNLYYLAERFRMTYNFIWRRNDDGLEAQRHLMLFQLLL